MTKVNILELLFFYQGITLSPELLVFIIGMCSLLLVVIDLLFVGLDPPSDIDTFLEMLGNLEYSVNILLQALNE